MDCLFDGMPYVIAGYYRSIERSSDYRRCNMSNTIKFNNVSCLLLSYCENEKIALCSLSFIKTTYKRDIALLVLEKNNTGR